MLTIDAWRADLAEHHLDHVMPNLVSSRQDRSLFQESLCSLHPNPREHLQLDDRPVAPSTGLFSCRVDKNDRFREIDDSYSIKQIQLLPLHDTSATLAQTLSQAGYKTAAIIPYVFFLRDAGITRGFEHIDDRAYLEANKKARGVTSPILTDQTIQWITKQKTPWMAWIHYLDPHNPYIPYGGVPQDAPMKVRYASELRRVDAEIERLLTALEDAGALDHTLGDYRI